MPCKLCGAEQFRPWLVGVPRVGSRVPSRFSIDVCERCGLRQTRPEPSPTELREAYGSAYTWKSATSLVSTLEAWYRQVLVRCDQARVAQLAARLANGKELLDVGCGDGLLITEVRRVGIVAHGVDRPGAPLWPGCDPSWREEGNIETIDQAPERWDIVTLFQVLEHVQDPLTLLARMHSWLRPNGILVLQVPNAASFQARLFRRRWNSFDIPRHLVHWTQPTLTRALRQTGYEVAAVRYVSLRDNGPAFASSLLPGLDPLVERERLLSGDHAPHPAALALRRLIFLGMVWALTPLTLLEAAGSASASIIVFARKGS